MPLKRFSFIIFIVFFIFGALEYAEAGAVDNVSGFAWSENIGWVSFNNTSGGGGVSYGVNINPSTGNFSGYAWSENIGWIDFAPAGPYPNPPNNSVRVNLSTYEVSGWARALAYGGGWDGWLKTRCQGGECGSSNYGVSINGSGQFQGFAWGSGAVGWLSFAWPGYGVVVTSPGIFNSPPGKPGIPPEYSPDGLTWNHCLFQEKSVPAFHWTYSDPDSDPQAAYEIEVDNNNAFAAPKFNHLVNLAATSYILDLSQDDDADWISALSWNTTYFWRVRVKDNQNNWSDWSNSSNFRTPDHAYPWVDFTWLPLEPIQGEIAAFDPDASEVYGGAAISAYSWSITQGTGVFVDSTNAASRYPHIQFSTLDNKINLQIIDTDGFSCAKEKDVAVELPLPEYKEISPIIWFRKIFTGLAVIWSRF